MLKVGEKISTNAPFESNKVGLSDGLSDLFKSIFDSKINNSNEKSSFKNYHLDNNILHADNDTFKKSTTLSFGRRRSEMLSKAEIARKNSDLDIQRAKDLLDKIDKTLDKRVNKKLRISKEQLKSAVRGLSKLEAENEVGVALASPEDLKQNKVNDVVDAINAGGTIILQLNDTKVIFTSSEESNLGTQEVYDGEITTNTKLASEMISSENDSIDKSKQQPSLNKQEQQNSGEDLKKLLTEEVGTEKNNSEIAKKIMNLVEEKSSITAKLVTEDKNLKIEIEPTAKSVKPNLTEKVISANQASANFLVMPPDNSESKVSKIAPSGNLNELLTTQTGVLQVNKNVVLPLLPDQEGFDQILEVKKENLPNAEISSMIKKDSMETSLDLSLAGSKLAQNTTSASVLDRINQVAMVQKISKRIELRQLKEFGIVNIHLDPPELGKLIVKLSIKNKEIKVSIIADSESSHDMLMNHKQVFMKSLQENGLEVTEFNVSTQDNSSQGSFSQSSNQESILSKGDVSEANENKNKLMKDDHFGSLESQDLMAGHQISLIA
jgi:flagellar hook-length control protein FliK